MAAKVAKVKVKAKMPCLTDLDLKTLHSCKVLDCSVPMNSSKGLEVPCA